MADDRIFDFDSLLGPGGSAGNAAPRDFLDKLKRHIEANVPMFTRKDGKTVVLSPEEMRKMLDEAEQA